MFAGTHTAIVTPFAAGQIDEPALKRLIAAQFAAGVTGVGAGGPPGGSTTQE
jgi:4-hydroxy-tetrahydrodipicolinate synthase